MTKIINRQFKLPPEAKVVSLGIETTDAGLSVALIAYDGPLTKATYLARSEFELLRDVVDADVASVTPTPVEPERTYTKGEQEVAAMILGFRDFVRSIKSDFAGGSELAEKLEAEAKGGRK